MNLNIRRRSGINRKNLIVQKGLTAIVIMAVLLFCFVGDDYSFIRRKRR